jgi:murein DD-endopeptidase MepM/ murein hydrolase activator NlpD
VIALISCFKGKFKVTSPRGYRTLGGTRQYHGGLDLVALGADKSVYAIADGVVDAVPYEAGGFGYYVRQKLPDGRRIYYGHMAKGSIVVKAGQTIKAGDKLGVMGSTGASTGAHTHIELRIPGTSKTSLDIAEFTGIPNKVGTYETEDKIDYAEKVQKKCGFEAQTMDYLKAYKWADALFEKLWNAMK